MHIVPSPALPPSLSLMKQDVTDGDNLQDAIDADNSSWVPWCPSGWCSTTDNLTPPAPSPPPPTARTASVSRGHQAQTRPGVVAAFSAWCPRGHAMLSSATQCSSNTTKVCFRSGAISFSRDGVCGGCSAVTDLVLGPSARIDSESAMRSAVEHSSVAALRQSAVLQVKHGAFSGCANLRRVRSLSPAPIPAAAFARSSIEEADTSLATAIGSNAFDSSPRLRSIDIRSATQIGESAFQNCTALVSANTSAAIEIGPHAFDGCHALEDVNAQSAQAVGGFAFANCAALTSVVLKSARRIGEHAFHKATGLKEVDLELATEVGANAFRDCAQLNAIDVNHDASIGPGAFAGTAGALWFKKFLDHDDRRLVWYL
tara:strand:+ start:136 stop:1251 length:1116 start_codon:yes stop_codon:yes gene_type:complete